MSAEVPVAIVGIGCKFPGGADTKELYYEFLRGKVSVVISPHWSYNLFNDFWSVLG
jgi:acyl transferase domain-containing protein